MKHKLNSKGQAGATADACKNAENLTSSQPIANAPVVCRLVCRTKQLAELKREFDERYKFILELGICSLTTYVRVRLFECLRCVESGQRIAFENAEDAV